MIFTIIQTAVGFVIPLIVIITLYTITIYKLRQNLNNVMSLIEKEAIRTRQRRNRRIFSMLIIVVGMFIICWCPYVLFRLFQFTENSIFEKTFESMLAFYITFPYMWYVLAAINPCIYFVFLRDFRKGLKILCCRKTTTANEPITRRPRTPGGDSNQHTTCTPPHINTTSV